MMVFDIELRQIEPGSNVFNHKGSVYLGHAVESSTPTLTPTPSDSKDCGGIYNSSFTCNYYYNGNWDLIVISVSVAISFCLAAVMIQWACKCIGRSHDVSFEATKIAYFDDEKCSATTYSCSETTGNASGVFQRSSISLDSCSSHGSISDLDEVFSTRLDSSLQAYMEELYKSAAALGGLYGAVNENVANMLEELTCRHT